MKSYCLFRGKSLMGVIHCYGVTENENNLKAIVRFTSIYN